MFNGENKRDALDCRLSEIAKECLKGEEGKLPATQICERLAEAEASFSTHIDRYSELPKSLAHVQPIVFLDVFLGNSGIKDYQRNLESSSNPINQISDSDLIAWSDRDPTIRYPLIASAIEPFSFSTETKGVAWKPIVHSIFERAPDLGAVLEPLANAIEPRSWGGSLADILQARSVLFQSLYQHHNPGIQDWARKSIKICRQQ